MSPGSPEQLFEQRLASLYREIDDVLEEAVSNPQIIAAQDARTQLFLSYLQAWRKSARPNLRIAG